MRPLPLLNDELRDQAGRLVDLRVELERRSDVASRAVGGLAVLDSNILLHCQPLKAHLFSMNEGTAPVHEDPEFGDWSDLGSGIDNEGSASYARPVIQRAGRSPLPTLPRR